MTPLTTTSNNVHINNLIAKCYRFNLVNTILIYVRSLENLSLKHTATITMSEETALIEVPPACPLCQAVSTRATCSFIWRSPEAVSGVWRIKTQ